MDHTRSRVIALQQFHETWILVLHARRRTELKAELPIWIGMEEVIARVVYDEDMGALPCGTANAVEYRPQVEIGDHASKPPTIGCKQRRGNPHGRNTRSVDHPTRPFEVNRRDVNVAGRKGDRLLEIFPIAILLKVRVGYRLDCATCS